MSHPLRVLVFANLPPWVLGGAENQVAHLVEAWIGLGHHIEVAGHQIPDGLSSLGEVGVRTHRIGVTRWFGRIGRAVSYFVSTLRLLARIGSGFDVVYTRGLGDAAISICVLKAVKLAKHPLVICPMGAGVTGDTRFVASIPGHKWLISAINNYCDAINLIAPAITNDLSAIGINTLRLSHIPNGIPVMSQLTRNSVSPVRRLIWTGRLSWGKGLDQLLLSLARIVASGRDFRLEILGDGPEGPALVACCRQLSLDGRVAFAGLVHRDAVRGRLAAADAFVLPSRYEGMSNAALEAMESGLPVLLTACGGIDTWIDDGVGWRCRPEDPDDLFAALCRLLDTPAEDLLAMGRRARKLVEREFEIGAVARRNAALLGEVAGLRKQGT